MIRNSIPKNYRKSHFAMVKVQKIVRRYESRTPQNVSDCFPSTKFCQILSSPADRQVDKLTDGLVETVNQLDGGRPKARLSLIHI